MKCHTKRVIFNGHNLEGLRYKECCDFYKPHTSLSITSLITIKFWYITQQSCVFLFFASMGFTLKICFKGGLHNISETRTVLKQRISAKVNIQKQMTMDQDQNTASLYRIYIILQYELFNKAQLQSTNSFEIQNIIIPNTENHYLGSKYGISAHQKLCNICCEVHVIKYMLKDIRQLLENSCRQIS